MPTLIDRRETHGYRIDSGDDDTIVAVANKGTSAELTESEAEQIFEADEAFALESADLYVVTDDAPRGQGDTMLYHLDEGGEDEDVERGEHIVNLMAEDLVDAFETAAA